MADQVLAQIDAAPLLQCGWDHCCALDVVSGGLRCWGRAEGGRLGVPGADINLNASRTLADVESVDLGEDVRVTALAHGLSHSYTCVIVEGGVVKCFGRRQDKGQFILGWVSTAGGTPRSMGDNTPVIPLPWPARQVFTAHYTACAISEEGGKVACWGPFPVREMEMGGMSAVKLGIDETGNQLCAIMSQGLVVRCWKNWSGAPIASMPFTTFSEQVVDIIFDPWSGWCVVTRTERKLVCEVSTGDGDLAATVSGVMQASGYDHVCVITENGELLCRGDNGSAELGRGYTSGIEDVLEPVDLRNGKWGRPVAVATQPTSTCALMSEGKVLCWGQGYLGRVDLGSTTTIIGDSPDEMGENLVPVTALDACSSAVESCFNVTRPGSDVVLLPPMNPEPELGKVGLDPGTIVALAVLGVVVGLVTVIKFAVAWSRRTEPQTAVDDCETAAAVSRPPQDVPGPLTEHDATPGGTPLTVAVFVADGNSPKPSSVPEAAPWHSATK